MAPDNKKSTEPAKGLLCHKCGCKDLRVVYTRGGTGGRVVRRRRCRACNTMVYTTEKSGL